MHLAIVGAGWAGLAAAVRAVEAGLEVSLLEMAPEVGGRARALTGAASADANVTLDNGQHLLIGAYRDTLQLMRTVGVDTEAVLKRTPLTLKHADGFGLSFARGPAAWAFTRAVAGCKAWPLLDRCRLLAQATLWALQGFRCAPGLTVAQLSAGLSPDLRRDFIDPLCVAALNTPASMASAQVFLRVLRDAMFNGPGSSDLLLPTRPLSELFPDPATRWLQAHGARLRTRTRVTALEKAPRHWRLYLQSTETLEADAVLLACSAHEAARLAKPHDTRWSELARALTHEPIITVILRAQRSAAASALPSDMVALHEGDDAPAQFLFHMAPLRPGVAEAQSLYTAVISGARRWSDLGLDATAHAVQRQVHPWLGPTEVLHACAEKRATLLCTPGLQRPAMTLSAPALLAAGDYVDGPYPSTLEGAVRSGLSAVDYLRHDRSDMPKRKTQFRNAKI